MKEFFFFGSDIPNEKDEIISQDNVKQRCSSPIPDVLVVLVCDAKRQGEKKRFEHDDRHPEEERVWGEVGRVAHFCCLQYDWVD